MRFDGKSTPGNIDRDQLKQLLTRGWMTHDGMWFSRCLQALGMEKANELNRGAIRAMAGLEVKRVKRALGMDEINDIKALREFFSGAFGLLLGDFMSFDCQWGGSSVRLDMERCFAHRGMVALGVAERYECGIFERIYAWLDVLGVEYTPGPQPPLCQMWHHGRCRREIELRFPAVG